MFDSSRVRKDRSVTLTASAGDRETLLVAWLNELLFLIEVEHLAAADCRITALGDTELRATVWGEAIDPARHALGSEVKAVTYNQLAVSQTESGWEARVVVDL